MLLLAEIEDGVDDELLIMLLTVQLLSVTSNMQKAAFLDTFGNSLHFLIHLGIR